MLCRNRLDLLHLGMGRKTFCQDLVKLTKTCHLAALVSGKKGRSNKSNAIAEREPANERSAKGKTGAKRADIETCCRTSAGNGAFSIRLKRRRQ